MPEPSWFELPVVSVGGWLVTIVGVLWMIITGRLIPKSTYKDILNDKDRQILIWQETAKSHEARADLLVSNQDKLLEGINTSNDLIRSLPGISERNAS